MSRAEVTVRLTRADDGKVLWQETLEAIEAAGAGLKLSCSDGTTLEADLVVCSTAVAVISLDFSEFWAISLMVVLISSLAAETVTAFPEVWPALSDR